ncbi:unnamed protein product [Schistocephalus solidus]|uniref:Reverse transcriptase domain-containing protein n=1 Tax=Schistocephalus solidus TaxID=70667 RepID=A0A183T7I4_SCHSO|nr:unnamed protein product [Schistocephalus solidus]
MHQAPVTGKQDSRDHSFRCMELARTHNCGQTLANIDIRGKLPITINTCILCVTGSVDWFDDNIADISNLLAEKNGLHKAYMYLRTDATKAAFYRSCRLVQQRLREMQVTWMIRKSEEIQGYADRNEMKNFFKAIYGPCIKGSAPLLSSDGTTLLIEESQILKRWAEHFRMDTNNDLDLPPSLTETIRAVQQISSGKAQGSDVIPPEVYKHGGPRLMAELTTLFQEMWRQGQAPQDFKDTTIVHLYKQMGQGMLPESQCGFRRNRGKTDMIFATRQLQEKCQKLRTHLYNTFEDLTKAFDTVHRDGLWKLMQKFGCPERFTHMGRQHHDGRIARVTDNGTVSEAFAVTNGVKQGASLTTGRYPKHSQ